MSNESIEARFYRNNNFLEKILNRKAANLSILSLLRLTSFILIPGWLIGVYLARQENNFWYSGFLIPLLAFLFFLNRFQKLENYIFRIKSFRKQINTERIRKALDFSNLPFISPENPIPIEELNYAYDLDITGQKGLIHFLDTTFSKYGYEQFHSNILQYNSKSWSEKQENQKSIIEICKQHSFVSGFMRLIFELNSDYAKFGKMDLDPLKKEYDSFFIKHSVLKKIFRIIPVLSWIVILGQILLDFPFASTAIVIQLFIFVYYRRNSLTRLQPYELFEERLEQLQKVFYLILKQKWESKNLANIAENIDLRETKEALRHLNKIIGRASISKSPSMHFLLNSLFLWDLWVISALEKWESKYKSRVLKLIETTEYIDSIIPFCNYNYYNENLTFPELLSSDDKLSGIEIGHPLIKWENRVLNPAEAISSGEVILITGSNMSGKTTYVRTIGIISILALCGSPVPAKEFKIPDLKIYTSIRNQDSLSDGISFFYSEVKRIAKIVKLTESSGKISLILLDEILKGTNTRERYIATKGIINRLQNSKSISFITTHDLELARIPKIKLKHFTENMVNDEMIFNYKIQDGIVQSSNALKVLALEGLYFED